MNYIILGDILGSSSELKGLALLLISIGNTEIFSNTLINLIYVVMIPGMPLLMFGNPLKNKKAFLEDISQKISKGELNFKEDFKRYLKNIKDL